MEYVKRGWVLWELSEYNDHVRIDDRFRAKVMKPVSIPHPEDYEKEKEYRSKF